MDEKLKNLETHYRQRLYQYPLSLASPITKRNQYVFGCAGIDNKTLENAQHRVMIIAEAPGETEAQEGIPLVGVSGQLLRETIHSVGIRDTYMTNIVHIRPPNNRDPDAFEIECELDVLRSIIFCVKPHFIICVGRLAYTIVSNGIRIPESNMRHLRKLQNKAMGNTGDDWDRDIAIRPDLFTTMDREDTSLHAASIMKNHGKIQLASCWVKDGDENSIHRCWMVGIFHPSYVLRNKDRKHFLVEQWKTDLKEWKKWARTPPCINEEEWTDEHREEWNLLCEKKKELEKKHVYLLEEGREAQYFLETLYPRIETRRDKIMDQGGFEKVLKETKCVKERADIERIQAREKYYENNNSFHMRLNKVDFDSQSNEFHVYGRNIFRDSVFCRVQDFLFTFYVHAPHASYNEIQQWAHDHNELEENKENCHRVQGYILPPDHKSQRGYSDTYLIGVVKLTCTNYNRWKDTAFSFSERFNIDQYSHTAWFETNVTPVEQFFLELELVAGQWMYCDNASTPAEKLSNCDAEYIARAPDVKAYMSTYPWELLLLSVDIECGNLRPENSPILCTSGVLQWTSPELVFDPNTGRSKEAEGIVVMIYGMQDMEEEIYKDYLQKMVVFCVKSEKDLLHVWTLIKLQIDPDAELGYNSNKFDFPFIFDRNRHLNVPRNNYDGRLRDVATTVRFYEFKTKAMGTLLMCETHCRGRMKFDLLDHMRKLKLSSNTLDSVASEFLGDKKVDVPYPAIIALFRKNLHTRKLLGWYNIKDCILPLNLFVKRMIMNTVSKMSSTTITVLPDDTGGIQKQVYGTLAHKLREDGHIWLIPVYGGLHPHANEDAFAMDEEAAEDEVRETPLMERIRLKNEFANLRQQELDEKREQGEKLQVEIQIDASLSTKRILDDKLLLHPSKRTKTTKGEERNTQYAKDEAKYIEKNRVKKGKGVGYDGAIVIEPRPNAYPPGEPPLEDVPKQARKRAPYETEEECKARVQQMEEEVNAKREQLRKQFHDLEEEADRLLVELKFDEVMKIGKIPWVQQAYDEPRYPWSFRRGRPVQCEDVNSMYPSLQQVYDNSAEAKVEFPKGIVEGPECNAYLWEKYKLRRDEIFLAHTLTVDEPIGCLFGFITHYAAGLHRILDMVKQGCIMHVGYSEQWTIECTYDDLEPKYGILQHEVRRDVDDLNIPLVPERYILWDRNQVREIHPDMKKERVREHYLIVNDHPKITKYIRDIVISIDDNKVAYAYDLGWGLIPRTVRALNAARSQTKKRMETSKNTNEKKMLNAEQEEFKRVANSTYGATGLSKKKGRLADKDLGAEVTAGGRFWLIHMRDAIMTKFPEDAHMEVHFASYNKTTTPSGALNTGGDSVTGDMPVLLRIKGEEKMMLIADLPVTYHIRYKNLLRESTNDPVVDNKRYAESDFEVWSEKGFTRVFQVMKHVTEKNVYQVFTTKGMVEVTEDHSLLLENGKEIKPEDLTHMMSMYDSIAGSPPITLMYRDFPEYKVIKEKTPSYSSMCSEEVPWTYEELKMFAFHYRYGTFQFTNEAWWTMETGFSLSIKKWIMFANVPNYLKKFLERTFSNFCKKRTLSMTMEWVNNNLLVGPKENKLTEYDIFGKEHVRIYYDDKDMGELHGWFKKQTLVMTHKGSVPYIPSWILNSSKLQKLVFLRCLVICKLQFDHWLYLFLAQILQLAASIGRSILIDRKPDSVESPVFTLGTLSPRRQTGGAIVLYVQKLPKQKRVVYDLTTENHHFHAGVGSLIVHNTDSFFVTFYQLWDVLRSMEAGPWIAQWINLQCPKNFRFAFEKIMSFFQIGKEKKRYFGNLYIGNNLPLLKKRWIELNHYPSTWRSIFQNDWENMYDDWDKKLQTYKNAILACATFDELLEQFINKPRYIHCDFDIRNYSEIFVKGYEPTRRSTPSYFKYVMTYIIHLICYQQYDRIIPFMRLQHEKLFVGAVPVTYLAESQKIAKAVYANPDACKALVVAKLEEKQGRKIYDVGDRVPMVQIKTPVKVYRIDKATHRLKSSKPKKTETIVHPLQVLIDPSIQIDYESYWATICDRIRPLIQFVLTDKQQQQCFEHVKSKVFVPRTINPFFKQLKPAVKCIVCNAASCPGCSPALAQDKVRRLENDIEDMINYYKKCYITCKKCTQNHGLASDIQCDSLYCPEFEKRVTSKRDVIHLLQKRRELPYPIIAKNIIMEKDVSEDSSPSSYLFYEEWRPLLVKSKLNLTQQACLQEHDTRLLLDMKSPLTFEPFSPLDEME